MLWIKSFAGSARLESAKAIKEADVWVVPYFSMLGLDKQTVAKALSPLAVPKFLAVQKGARNQMRLLKEFGIRKIGFSTDIIGDPVALTKQNNEFGYRLEAWSSHEVLMQATSLNGELMALSGQFNPYPDGPLGVIKGRRVRGHTAGQRRSFERRACARKLH